MKLYVYIKMEPVKKKAGRPKGSLNKVKTPVVPDALPEPVIVEAPPDRFPPPLRGPRAVHRVPPPSLQSPQSP